MNHISNWIEEAQQSIFNEKHTKSKKYNYIKANDSAYKVARKVIISMLGHMKRDC